MMLIFFFALLSFTTSKTPINYLYKPILSKETRFIKAELSVNASNILIETDRPNFIIPIAKIAELKKFSPVSETKLEISDSLIKKPFFKFKDFLITTLIKTLPIENVCFEISKEQEENNLDDGFVICSEEESIFSEIENIRNNTNEKEAGQEAGQELDIIREELKRDFMVDAGNNGEEKVFIGRNGIETLDGRVLFNMADIDRIYQQLGNPCCLTLMIRGVERSLCIKEISCEREKQIFIEKFHERKMEIKRAAVLNNNQRISAFVIDDRRHEFDAYLVIVEEKILLYKHRYDITPAVIIDLQQIRSIVPLSENKNVRYFDEILFASHLKGVNPYEKCLVVEIDDKIVLCSRKINRLLKKIEEKPIYDRVQYNKEIPKKKIIDKLNESSLNKTRILASKQVLANIKQRIPNITLHKIYSHAQKINNLNIDKKKLNYSSSSNLLNYHAPLIKTIIKANYSSQKNVSNNFLPKYQKNNNRSTSQKDLKNKSIGNNSKNLLAQKQPVQTKVLHLNNQVTKIDQSKSVFESTQRTNQKAAVQKPSQIIKAVSQRKNLDSIPKVRSQNPIYQFYMFPGNVQISLSFDGNAVYKNVGQLKQKLFPSNSCDTCLMKANPCCLKISRSSVQRFCSMANNCYAIARYAYSFLKKGCNSQKEEYCSSFDDLVQNEKNLKNNKRISAKKFK